MLDFTHGMKHTLKRAVETYGAQRQICVAAEELCELSSVLMKYARYDTHDAAVKAMREKVIDEVADVVVMINQLYTIFDLHDPEVFKRAQAKVARLEGWLAKSDSLQQSTTDREVPDEKDLSYLLDKHCKNCDWYKDTEMCDTCVDKDKYTYRNY